MSQFELTPELMSYTGVSVFLASVMFYVIFKIAFSVHRSIVFQDLETEKKRSYEEFKQRKLALQQERKSLNEYRDEIHEIEKNINCPAYVACYNYFDGDNPKQVSVLFNADEGYQESMENRKRLKQGLEELIPARVDKIVSVSSITRAKKIDLTGRFKISNIVELKPGSETEERKIA